SSLKEQQVQLFFTVVANDLFRTGEPNKRWRRLEFSDMLIRPATWVDLFFGKYSRVKHEFMIEATGERWDTDFMRDVAQGQINYAQFWRAKLREALAEYNNAHPGNPLTDEVGELVLFP